MREHRHGCESPDIVNRFYNGWEILTCSCRFHTPTNGDKLSEKRREDTLQGTASLLTHGIHAVRKEPV